VTGSEFLLLLVMLLGLAGVVVPVLPGLWLILGAGIVWAVADGGGLERWAAVVVMALMAVAGAAAPYALSNRRSAGTGVPGWVSVAGLVGALIGFFAVPVVGALVGFPAGIFVAELGRVRDIEAAWHATWEAIKGLGMGIAIGFATGVAMIGVWVVTVFTT
jgi:uncharacterized protein